MKMKPSTHIIAGRPQRRRKKNIANESEKNIASINRILKEVNDKTPKQNETQPFRLKPLWKRLLPSLELSNTLIPREHLREGKHPQNAQKIRPSHVTQLLIHCERKGQKNGFIPHRNIQKNWLESYTEMLIYHSDLSIF